MVIESFKQLADLYNTGKIHSERILYIDNDDMFLYLPVDESKWTEPPDDDDDEVRVWPPSQLTPEDGLIEVLNEFGISAEPV